MEFSISIVIPTYKRPVSVVVAVKSALAGCPDNGEVIVVADRSDTARTSLAELMSDARLHVTDNEYEKGAAGARNFGVTKARSEIILFLDDDDEMAADYPGRVITIAKKYSSDFGFANVNIMDHAKDPPNVSPSRRSRHLKQGEIEPDVPLEHKLFATSCGLWIRKSVFASIGGISTDQTVDEDTDLSCRLYGHGYCGWFETNAGMLVHQGCRSSDGSNPHLSTGTKKTEIAECYARTFKYNQHLFKAKTMDRWFLYRRALRNCAKNGVDRVAHQLLNAPLPASFRYRGWLYWRVKKLGAAMRK